LIDNGLIGAWIDLGADLSLLHLSVVVAMKLLDDTGNISPDDDGELRIDNAGRRHRAGDRASTYRRGCVLNGSVRSQQPPHARNADGKQDGQEPRNQQIFPWMARGTCL
jgi:hypothetical protein